jgi:pyruvate/2-oxoglutarate dehydrogenase complex dihydrolipoamide acyltransferase (E2) component
VSDLLSLDELQKAAGNLKRIQEFLSTRLEWHLELEGFEALHHLDGSAAAIIRTMDPLLDAHGIRADWGGHTAPEQLPTSKFDSVRLDKLGAFMVQLDAWFRDHAVYPVEDGGEQHLSDIYGALHTIRKAVVPIFDASPYRESVPDERPPGDMEIEAVLAEPEPAPAQPAPAPAEPEPAPAQPEPAPTDHAMVSAAEQAEEVSGSITTPGVYEDRLVLEDTADTPLTQTFQNEAELTATAKEMIAGILDRFNVEFTAYQRKKFEAVVVRRIQRTPAGQVLVIKVGDIEGKPKPYFGYQPKFVEPWQ